MGWRGFSLHVKLKHLEGRIGQWKKKRKELGMKPTDEFSRDLEAFDRKEEEIGNSLAEEKQKQVVLKEVKEAACNQ